jgi:hypothetical protein
MGRVLPETGWRQWTGLIVQPDVEGGALRRIAGDGTDHLVMAQTLAARLFTSAAAYLAVASCRDGVCALGAVDGAREACALAADLAPLATTAVPPVAGDPGRVYLAALSDAAAAVYYCRRTAHPGGTCWFSAAGPDADGCGRVLVAAHRIR